MKIKFNTKAKKFLNSRSSNNAIITRIESGSTYRVVLSEPNLDKDGLRQATTFYLTVSPIVPVTEKAISE